MKHWNIFGFNFELKFSRKTTNSENRTTNFWKTVFLQSCNGGKRSDHKYRDKRALKQKKTHSLNIGNFKIVAKADK